MRLSSHFSGAALLLSGLALLLGMVSADPTPVDAQFGPPSGVVAFIGTDMLGEPDIYLLDLSSGRMGQLDAPITPDVDMAWHPDGASLAFTTDDGGYGLLQSLRGCFDADSVCTDLVYVIPPFIISELEWDPAGENLILLTDEGMKMAPPRRARARDMEDLAVECEHGFDVSSEPLFLLCAADSGGNRLVEVYEMAEDELASNYTIGTFPDVTSMDIGPLGQAAIGTLETGGDSGFFASESGAANRLAQAQIHVYGLEFNPEALTLVIVGATADSTGDGTLRDGDTAELFLYDTATGQITQVQGFTNATYATWSADGARVLVIIGDNTFQLYDPISRSMTPIAASLPVPGLTAASPQWQPTATGSPGLPNIPTATPFATITPFPTPFATMTPFPTITPLPTMTPYPTITPYVPPSPTPGSPMGSGCQYAVGIPPVTIGDTAQVTLLGAGLRLRAWAALDATQVTELPRYTRMLVLNGPVCSQGYRWWEVRLESDGRTGWVADSGPDTRTGQSGYWIEYVEVIPPTPTESINFFADRYSIVGGQCVTIWWDVEGIKEVYFQGIGVTGHESRVECPAATTSYVLRVVRNDNSIVEQTITIFVVAPY